MRQTRYIRPDPSDVVIHEGQTLHVVSQRLAPGLHQQILLAPIGSGIPTHKAIQRPDGQISRLLDL